MLATHAVDSRKSTAAVCMQLDGQPGAEVLRRRMQLLSHMLNSFNSGGVDEFPKLIRDLYHEVPKNARTDCLVM